MNCTFIAMRKTRRGSSSILFIAAFVCGVDITMIFLPSRITDSSVCEREILNAAMFTSGSDVHVRVNQFRRLRIITPHNIELWASYDRKLIGNAL